jgi:SHS2 domain-containing protein
MSPFELFDHTADLGLRVRADDLNTLFRDAAVGLFAMIAERVPADDPGETLRFRIDGSRLDWLLFDWLNELLFTFESRGLLLHGFEVEVGSERVDARASAVAFDAGKQRALREVKAITYHGLRVERIERGWIAEVIVDI